ncbi:hypothetical protein CLU79DRAFT_775974 [Phycomyces nitens]|nr:hypothetical protein CLU79DRAFT_775974 [Phycomyces nitens]
MYAFDQPNPLQLQAIANLCQTPITDDLLDLVACEFESIIPCTDNTFLQDNPVEPKPDIQAYKTYHDLPSPPLSSSDKHHDTSQFQKFQTSTPSLRAFISTVVKRSQTTTGTLLSSLVYAQRLRSKLAGTSKGMRCTHHRIFLATLITVTKYLHDTAPRNKYWVWYAQLFSASEISLMERQLLQLLEYDLGLPIDCFNQVALVYNHTQSRSTKYHDPYVCGNQHSISHPRRLPPFATLFQTDNLVDCEIPYYHSTCPEKSASLSSSSSSSTRSSFTNLSYSMDYNGYADSPIDLWQKPLFPLSNNDCRSTIQDLDHKEHHTWLGTHQYYQDQTNHQDPMSEECYPFQQIVLSPFQSLSTF